MQVFCVVSLTLFSNSFGFHVAHKFGRWSRLSNNFEMSDKTMKAAVVTQHKAPFTILDLPIPSPGPGQALVKISASGVCHTDVHAVDGDWPVLSRLPLTPGHEGAGIVVEVGEGVHNIKVGDRVGIPWLHSACGECEFCTSGWESLCPNQENTGFSVNGCHGEYALAKASHAVKIPDSLSFAQAARKTSIYLIVQKYAYVFFFNLTIDILTRAQHCYVRGLRVIKV